MSKPTNEQIAKMFGCTVEQVRALAAKNAKGFSEMADKAERTGKKVNGYTASQLRQYQREAELQAGVPA